MHNLRICGLILAAWLITSLGAYEVTAKSPGLLGRPLPGWWATVRAEHSVRWTQPTGLLPLDKLLHEGHEAVCYYGLIWRAPGRGAPDFQI